jgi:hypothetical protein
VPAAQSLHSAQRVVGIGGCLQELAFRALAVPIAPQSVV